MEIACGDRRHGHNAHPRRPDDVPRDRVERLAAIGVTRAWLLVTLACAVFTVGVALAQADTLALHVAKSWGYAWRNEMQGVFNLTVDGPPDIVRVTFLLDGTTLAEVSTPPFQTQFTTDDHSLGAHVLAAQALTADGRTLHAPDVHVTFVGAERGMQMALRIAGPILVVVLGFVVLMVVVSVVGDRRTRSAHGAAQHYGPLGGAICPKCGRPFALRMLSVSLITRRYDRCPHCGKWSIVKTASASELDAAEAALHETGDGYTAADIVSDDAEARLHRALDESRYVDG